MTKDKQGKPMKKVQYFFPLALLLRLRKATTKSGLSVSAIVREAVEARVSKIEGLPE